MVDHGPTKSTTDLGLDARSLASLEELAKDEGLDPARVVASCVRSFLDLSPDARRALMAIDDKGDGADRAIVAKSVGRAALRAYEGLLGARQAPKLTEDGAWDEAALEAEEIRILCR